MSKHVCGILLSLFVGVVSLETFAAATSSPGLSYTGRITKADGTTPITSSGVTFSVAIYDVNHQCLMLTETRTLDLSTSNGTFSFDIGDGTGVTSYKGNVSDIYDLFNNGKAFAGLPVVGACGGSFTPAASNEPRVLMVSFDAGDGNGPQTLPALKINPSAFAGQAGNAQKLAGYGTGDLLRIDSAVNKTTNANTDLTQTQYDELWRLIKNPGTAYASSGSTGLSPNLNSAQIYVGNSSNGAQARAMSGDVSMDNAGVVTLATTGVTAGTYSKVAVNAKGLITSGSSLVAADITGALGYTPASSSGSLPALTAGQIFVGNTSGAAEAMTMTGDGSLSSSAVLSVDKTTTGQSNKILALDGAGVANVKGVGINTGTGNVALQTAASTANYSITLPATAPGNNQILQSDATGVLSWINTPSGGSSQWTTSGNDIYNSNSGNVGIGNLNPTAKLDMYRDFGGAGGGGVTLLKMNGNNPGDANFTFLDLQLSGFSSFKVTGDGSVGANKVGAGVSSPSHMLDVYKDFGGTVPGGISVAKVNGNNPAAGDYNLLELSQNNVPIFLFANSGVATLPQVKITGGSPGAGKVLTSNATGLATWETPSGGGGSSDASSITTGTMDAARLPAASGSADGIVNQIAQSFAGVKTFLSNVIVQGAFTVSGDVTGSGAGKFDHIQVANSSATCDATTEGSLKYNSTRKVMEFCNGTAWKGLAGDIASYITFTTLTPSYVSVNSAAAYYSLYYSSGTESSTITLSASDIQVSGSDTTGCVVSTPTLTGGNPLGREFSVSGCTGNGPLSINIPAGTAKGLSGEDTAAAGPINYYTLDNTGPTAPTGLSWGTPTLDLDRTPPLNFTGATDSGAGVMGHMYKIVETISGTVLKDWSLMDAIYNNVVVSGSPLYPSWGFVFTPGVDYTISIKGVDNIYNEGQIASIHWTPDGDGPTAPTGLVATPGIAQVYETNPVTYTGAVDVGYAGLDHHELRVLKTSDSSVVRDWYTHSSGQPAQFYYEENTAYTIEVRGVDKLQNAGAAAQASWTSPAGSSFYAPIAVSQSSIYNANSTATLANLSDFDGSTGGGTNGGASTITLDLGSVKTVGTVHLGAGYILSWDYVASYLNGAQIEYSVDNSTWTAVGTVSGMTDSGPDQFKDFTFTPVSARYIRLSRGNYLAVTEFVVGP